MLFYGGIAGGVVLVSRAPSGARNLNQYLFGSITTTSTSDLDHVLGAGRGDPAP